MERHVLSIFMPFLSVHINSARFFVLLERGKRHQSEIIQRGTFEKKVNYVRLHQENQLVYFLEQKALYTYRSIFTYCERNGYYSAAADRPDHRFN